MNNIINQILINQTSKPIPNYKIKKYIVSLYINLIYVSFYLCKNIDYEFAITASVNMTNFINYIMSYFNYNKGSNNLIFSDIVNPNFCIPNLSQNKSYIDNNLDILSMHMLPINTNVLKNNITDYKILNTKKHDIDFICSLINNKNLVPYILQNTFQLDSLTSLCNMILFLQHNYPSVIHDTLKCILFYDTNQLDTIISTMSKNFINTYNKLKINDNVQSLMNYYASLNDTNINVIITNLKSSDDVTFNASKRELKIMFFNNVNKFNSLVLLLIVLSQLLALFITYVKYENAETVYNHTHLNKFIEILTVNNILSPEHINIISKMPLNHKQYKSINDSLKTLIDNLNINLQDMYIDVDTKIDFISRVCLNNI